MEAEENGGENELQAQDEGLEEEEVDSEGHTGQEEQQRHTGGQGSLTQIPLPT